jgi:hypothetical protein
MMDAESNAIRINQFYAARTPQDAPEQTRTDICSSAAQTRWAGRGGPSTTIRISTLLAARLAEAIPQPDRRKFVEAAIEEMLAALERRTQ